MEHKPIARSQPSNSSCITWKEHEQQYLIGQGSPPRLEIAGLFLAEYLGVLSCTLGAWILTQQLRQQPH
jgi:hypothetical protein